MLKTTRVADTASANRLTQLWAARYSPDLSLLPAQKGDFPTAQLVEAASIEGRSKTVSRMKRLLRLNCELAGLETNSLFAYVPNIVNLAEARRLAEYVVRVYDKTFVIYQSQQPPSPYLKYIDASSNLFSKLAMQNLMLPVIHQLAIELEPEMLRLQDQHLASADSRAIGFITTQFHFSTREMVKHLTDCERVLLSPYLQFVEEQVCIPWQRICAAASNYASSAPELELVEHLLPMSREIAKAVFQRSLQHYSRHRSRRGALTNDGVAASTQRDLNMFQGYLWLCVLEQSLDAIEHELLPLCITVFPSVSVQWELVEQMVQLLVQEIHNRAKPRQMPLLQSYTQALQQIFAVYHLRSSLPV